MRDEWLARIEKELASPTEDEIRQAFTVVESVLAGREIPEPERSRALALIATHLQHAQRDNRAARDLVNDLQKMHDPALREALALSTIQALLSDGGAGG